MNRNKESCPIASDQILVSRRANNAKNMPHIVNLARDMRTAELKGQLADMVDIATPEELKLLNLKKVEDIILRHYLQQNRLTQAPAQPKAPSTVQT